MKAEVNMLHPAPAPSMSIPNSLPPLSPHPFSRKPHDPAPTLLVVDEDWVFREFEARALGDGGYTVLKANGAAEAMALARSRPIIHLFLTDFSIGGLDGLELTNQFRSLHPEAPVLMFTGSLPLPSHRTQKLERFAVLARPFDVQGLLHKVRSLLDIVAPLPMRQPLCSK